MRHICPLGWRKIAFYFNLSFEIKDKSIEFDENRNVLRAEFVVRAYMQYGFPFWKLIDKLVVMPFTFSMLLYLLPIVYHLFPSTPCY